MTLKKQEYIQIIISGIAGIFVIVFATIIGNFILIEITISFLISIYFGITLLITGVRILIRVRRLPTQLEIRKKLLNYFAILIIMSGIISICLERDWNYSLGYFTKIPLYIILSISVSFLLIYGIVGIINYCFGVCLKSKQKTLVETPNQVIVIIIISLLIGFLQGLLFSALNIEEIKNFESQSKLVLFEELLLMPFILTFGWIGGGINEYLRMRGNYYAPYTFEVVHDPFEEEI